MNKAFLILALTFSSLALKATVCVDRTFKEEYVNLYICQNYSNYSMTRTLLFKARTQALNEYISEEIKSGRLQEKKFEIQLYDALLTYQHLNLSQGKNGCFVSYSGFPSIQQLKAIVHSFGEQDWKPFFTSDYQKVDVGVISKQIDRFFSNQLVLDTVLPEITVWKEGRLKLDYLNDTLKYFVDSIPLAFQVTLSLPVKIQDRFLFVQSDSIFVLQGHEVIGAIKITKPISEDYSVQAYKSWVNICNGGSDNWMYSYSYDRNRFYKRPDK